MLPAAYVTPAAVLLVLGGTLACFFGYRLFRVVLAVYGFILGAAIASSVMSPGDTTSIVVAAIVGGIVGAVVLNLAYFLGVALIGAGAGALAIHSLWAAFGRGDPHVALVIVFAVAGALIATRLQRYVIILGTAFGGAWTAIVGVLAILGDHAARGAARSNDVWIAYPTSPERWWMIVVWLAAGAIGTFVQLATGAKMGPKKKTVKRKKK
jgi:hypothetical protein